MLWTLLLLLNLTTASANEMLLADWASTPEWWSERQTVSYAEKTKFAAQYVGCEKGFQPSYRETGLSRQNGDVKLDFFCVDPGYELPRNWFSPKFNTQNRKFHAQINPQIGPVHKAVQVAEEPKGPGEVDRVSAADLADVLEQQKPAIAFTAYDDTLSEPVQTTEVIAQAKPEAQIQTPAEPPITTTGSIAAPSESELPASEPLTGKIPTPKPRNPPSLEKVAAGAKIPRVIFARAYAHYKEKIAKGETDSPCFYAVDLTAPNQSRVWKFCTSPIASVEITREDFGRGTGPECNKKNRYVNRGVCAQFFGDRENACLSVGGGSMRTLSEGSPVPAYSYPTAYDIRRARRGRKVYWNSYCNDRIEMPSWLAARQVRPTALKAPEPLPKPAPAEARSSN